MLKIFLYVTLYMYIATGLIIGVRLSKYMPKWYGKVAIVILHSFLWMPSIPADMIVSWVEMGMEDDR